MKQNRYFKHANSQSELIYWAYVAYSYRTNCINVTRKSGSIAPANGSITFDTCINAVKSSLWKEISFEEATEMFPTKNLRCFTGFNDGCKNGVMYVTYNIKTKRLKAYYSDNTVKYLFDYKFDEYQFMMGRLARGNWAEMNIKDNTFLNF